MLHIKQNMSFTLKQPPLLQFFQNQPFYIKRAVKLGKSSYEVQIF